MWPAMDLTRARRLSVAPMMDWTDRHCRAFHRAFTRQALLYTEMVTTGAVIHGDRARLIGFDPLEQPVALQLGGSDPADLAEAARIGEAEGYAEINLNVGCPSDRVQSGRFGACLMREPELVAACMAAMKAAVAVPVTVKCRIGVDDQSADEGLFALVAACADAGVWLVQNPRSTRGNAVGSPAALAASSRVALGTDLDSARDDALRARALIPASEATLRRELDALTADGPW